MCFVVDRSGRVRRDEDKGRHTPEESLRPSLFPFDCVFTIVSLVTGQQHLKLPVVQLHHLVFHAVIVCLRIAVLTHYCCLIGPMASMPPPMFGMPPPGMGPPGGPPFFPPPGHGDHSGRMMHYVQGRDSQSDLLK